MKNSLVCIRQPINLALNLNEVKKYMRITDESQDDLIQNAIKAAMDSCEVYTGLSLINQDWQVVFTNLRERSVQLPKYPIRKIMFVEMINSYGRSTILSKVHYDVNMQTSQLFFSFELPTDKIRVEFFCGFGSEPDDIPQDLRFVLMEHVAFLLENRGTSEQFPMQKYALYRNMQI